MQCQQTTSTITNAEISKNILYKIAFTVQQRDDSEYLVRCFLFLADVSRPNYTAQAQDSSGVIFDFGQTFVSETIGDYDLYRHEQDLSQNIH